MDPVSDNLKEIDKTVITFQKSLVYRVDPFIKEEITKKDWRVPRKWFKDGNKEEKKSTGPIPIVIPSYRLIEEDFAKKDHSHSEYIERDKLITDASPFQGVILMHDEDNYGPKVISNNSLTFKDINYLRIQWRAVYNSE